MIEVSVETPKIALIVAVAENGVIGNAGDLPWRLSSDLKRFRALTMGKPLIMGRKTFQSLKKPLDGRDNIVVTRDPEFSAPGTHVVHTLEAALDLARSFAKQRKTNEVMVIGGAEIYRAALDHADRIYWTSVCAVPEGDTLFPPLPIDTWTSVAEEEIPKGPNDDYAARLRILERKRANNDCD